MNLYLKHIHAPAYRRALAGHPQGLGNCRLAWHAARLAHMRRAGLTYRGVDIRPTVPYTTPGVAWVYTTNEGPDGINGHAADFDACVAAINEIREEES